MPCPVTSGFLYSLQNSGDNDDGDFDDVRDAEGTFHELRVEAVQELAADASVYKARAQRAIVLMAALATKDLPRLYKLLTSATSGKQLEERVTEARDDVKSLLVSARMKLQAGTGDALELSKRQAVYTALIGLQCMFHNFWLGEYRAVGQGLGDAFLALTLPRAEALKIGRLLLATTEAQ